MGHASNKMENLERLAFYLIDCHASGGATVIEMMQYLGVSRDTANTYKNELDRKFGLTQDGSRYSLDPNRYISNVSLTIAEAWGIYLGLRRFARQITYAPDFVISGLQKVAQALRHPDLTDKLVEASRDLQHDQFESDKQGQIWQTLIDGWREKIVVRISYRGFRDDSERVHEIEPLLFEPATLSHGAYLIAWSQTRDSLRTFKLTRISRASLTTKRFEPREFDFKDLLHTAWGIWYGQDLIKVELLFSPRVASRVRETLWHPSQEIVDQEDGSVYWSVKLGATVELLSWVRGWGPDVEVLAPMDLRQEVMKHLYETLEIYAEGK